MDRNKLHSMLQQIKALSEECLRACGEEPEPSVSVKRRVQTKMQISTQLDFEKPIRPFIKMNASGLSGPKKFVLLLAWLAKGDLKKEIALSEIEANWNRMTSLLEMKFNRFFPAQAKDNDWVESKKKAQYNLRPAWRDALKRKS